MVKKLKPWKTRHPNVDDQAPGFECLQFLEQILATCEAAGRDAKRLQEQDRGSSNLPLVVDDINRRCRERSWRVGLRWTGRKATLFDDRFLTALPIRLQSPARTTVNLLRYYPPTDCKCK